METDWLVHWEPKLGNSIGEYEDAYYPPSGKIGAERFAVADGATESSYSRDWADKLTTRYGSGASYRRTFLRELPKLQRDWVAEHAHADLPWFAQQKLQQGSFAAFVGIRLLENSDRIRMHALAIGDCEIAHLRGDLLHCVFPLGHSSQFGIHPRLLGTTTTRDAANDVIRARREELFRGDDLLLMTDGIGAWFLAQTEKQESPWRDLLGFGSDDGNSFAAWADQLRSTGEMRNDDVTFGRLRIR